MHRLGVGRDSLRRALDELVDLRLIVRYPGYGHPLRPEYLVLPAGAALVEPAVELVRELDRLGATDPGLKKWSMPVVHALGTDSRRFSELRAYLPLITARALTLALKDLVATGLVERTVTDGFPPSTSYRLTPAARPLLGPLDRLGREDDLGP
ncbi:MAG TPA: winged helix-turn-helix transcriptional regulator [Gaiellaceae bacterium]|jgi:DNA-binding HxlR family transcriptional regulator|nr:winged helix-turn-helix transcriptional regulator [Gaiellaceae bacterium]